MDHLKMYFHVFPTNKNELSIATLVYQKGFSPDETPAASILIHQVTLL